MNNAAVNMRVQISLQNSNLNSSDINSAVGILDHVAVVQIEENSVLFIIRGYAILQSFQWYIREQISLCFHYHLSFLIAILLWGTISQWFLFLFIWWLVATNTFSYICWLCTYILWLNVYSNTLSLFGLFVFVLVLSCRSSLYIEL